MRTLLNLLLRLLLIAAGLMFALSLAVVFLLVLALWSLRAAWARLTGRPVAPFVVRVSPLDGFEQMMRRAPPADASRTPRADAAGSARRPLGDVTDVEPK